MLHQWESWRDPTGGEARSWLLASPWRHVQRAAAILNRRYQMVGEGRKGKLTAVWVVRVIVGDIDGASVELAFGRYIRNATRDL